MTTIIVDRDAKIITFTDKISLDDLIDFATFEIQDEEGWMIDCCTAIQPN
jgi:hypothetical protein